MRVVSTFPHRVREVEHLEIPLADGGWLAARLWLPEAAGTAPVPALVEYIPYGKREGTRQRDERMHGWFAGHGYAVLRIDLRGSGESDGLLLDEYLEQELADGCEAIAWIARQAWCTGAVGLLGKSWGGFNALQIAARQPPALRAILSVCSTDDRYADDVHYMGGCLLGENLVWGAVFFQLAAQPPDPALVGERWRELWLARLAHAHPFPATWLRHPRRDAYWKHGSVREDYASIRCPVYAVGGWADGYTNAIPRLLAGLRVPRRGLIGPWGHQYPHEGAPGPAIGFLQEALRWWDHWLRGVDRGIAEEPRLRAWLPEGAERDAAGNSRGRWVAEASWPSPRLIARRFALNPGRLDERAEPEHALAVRSPETTGSAAGSWTGFGAARDQREDDARSLVFDSAPLTERLEILGAPVVELELACDATVGMVVVRLCDVSPDGASARVSYGVLNLAHRESHEHPAPLEPGRRVRVRVALCDAAHAFVPGQRLRVAISNRCWPLVWPPAAAAALTLYTGSSRLALPVRPPHAADDALPPFAEPEAAPTEEYRVLRSFPPERRVERDPRTGETVVSSRFGADPAGQLARARLDAIDLEGGDAMTLRYAIRDDDPLSARAELSQITELQRAAWSVRIETRLELSCSATAFRLRARLTAFEGGSRVCEREWDEEIKRELL